MPATSSINSKAEHLQQEVQDKEIDPNARFGGLEARKKMEKRLLWKLDARMSILIIIYILNYIDRNNASAAKLQGFTADLGVDDQQYATLLSILYVGYILMQIPSNMFLNWVGKPSIYLPCCMLVWGMISVLTGITKNFVGALLTRFFLGFVEAAFYPGALFLLSKWYKRDEIGLRTAILTCGNIISNGFGTLIASGILGGMEGKLDHRAWRWLFFIEGALTMAFAVVAMFVLPDFPETTRWLSPEERDLAMLRMTEDVGIADTTTEETGNGLVAALTDWKVWFMAVALASLVVALSFNAYFPTLTATLGYNSTNTLLLCAPPWVFTALYAFAVSRHSDKTQERFVHMAIPFALAIIGFIISISTMHVAARYVSLFLMAQAYAGFIIYYAWISNSFPRPAAKRAVAIAFINAFSQLGNVAGSYVWPGKFGPTYRSSYAICIATMGTAIVMAFIFRTNLQRLNRKAERDEQEQGLPKGFRYLI